MKEALKKLLAELTKLDGVSGGEGMVAAHLVKLLKPYADSVEVDALGNVIVARRGRSDRPTLMVAAHSDEIGCVVSAIEESGFLRLRKLGITLDALLVGRKVLVNGRPGVIGVKGGHLQSEEERRRVRPISELYVDVGASSRAEVEGMGIKVGDRVAYLSELTELANPDRVCGKAIDNRAGCALLVHLFRELEGAELPGTLYGVVNSQEEVGVRGARVSAYRLNPDCAIVVDTIPSGDTPDTDTLAELAIYIGRGPVVPVVSDWGGIGGYLMHPGVKDWLVRLAEQRNIPYQLAVFYGASTDAAAIHLVREGIPTGVINIPRRYSHSPVEVLDLNDLVNSYRLLRAVVDDMETVSHLTFLPS